MRAFSWLLGGLAIGVAYVLVAGILDIQVDAIRSGAVVNLNNEVVAVRSPGTPGLQWLSGALLSGLIFYGVAVHSWHRSNRDRVAIVIGFVIAVLLLVAWSATIQGQSAPGTPTVGTALGWRGWIQRGGTNAAVHLLVVLSLGAMFTSLPRRPISLRNGSTSEPAPGGDSEAIPITKQIPPSG